MSFQRDWKKYLKKINFMANETLFGPSTVFQNKFVNRFSDPFSLQQPYQISVRFHWQDPYLHRVTYRPGRRGRLSPRPGEPRNRCTRPNQNGYSFDFDCQSNKMLYSDLSTDSYTESVSCHST